MSWTSDGRTVRPLLVVEAVSKGPQETDHRMSEMIERVARVLSRRDNSPPWDSLRESYRQSLRTGARAIIAAMREPTKSMVEAGMREASTTLADEWRAMIDEALK